MEMVNREIEEAKLEKLEAETAVEYAQSIVQYNTKRIDRLNTYIAEKEKAKWNGTSLEWSITPFYPKCRIF